jgi:hypothetical protein
VVAEGEGVASDRARRERRQCGWGERSCVYDTRRGLLSECDERAVGWNWFGGKLRCRSVLRFTYFGERSVRGHQVMIHKSAKRWWLTDPDAMTSLFLKDVFSSCKTKRWRGVWADALKDRASPGSTPGLRRYLVGVWPDAPKCRSQI